jgi:hypothetical protein
VVWCDDVGYRESPKQLGNWAATRRAGEAKKEGVGLRSQQPITSDRCDQRLHATKNGELRVSSEDASKCGRVAWKERLRQMEPVCQWVDVGSVYAHLGARQLESQWARRIRTRGSLLGAQA